VNSRRSPLKNLTLASACVVLTACGPSTSDKQPSPAPVEPNQHLAWEQKADTEADLAGYTFTLYVDGEPATLSDVSCSDLSKDHVAHCTGRLPAFSPGLHTLTLSTSDAYGRQSTWSDSWPVAR
jgi:hypothetical protein